MLIKTKIGILREAMTQASYTLDTKASSVGSWLYLIARKESLYVYSSNLGLARTLLKIPAVVTKEGEVLILPRLLQSALNSLPVEEDIELGLSASGAKLQVKYGSIKSEIAVHAESEKAREVLQTIPFDAKPSTSISASTLVEVINRTLFCTASGASAISEGPWLSSLCLETGDGIVMGKATNRIIAGKAEIPDGLVTSGFSTAIHRDALIALKAILSKRQKEEVTITHATFQNPSSSNEVLFRFSDCILGVRQLASAYPKAVEKIFTTPSDFNTATVNRIILLHAFSRLKAFAEKSTFTFTFAGEKVTLTSKGFDSIFQEQVAKTEKTEGTITVGLGLNDVMTILMAMQSEEVVIRYKTDGDHIHFQEGESKFFYVLSPVVVAWQNKGKAA